MRVCSRHDFGLEGLAEFVRRKAKPPKGDLYARLDVVSAEMLELGLKLA